MKAFLRKNMRYIKYATTALMLFLAGSISAKTVLNFWQFWTDPNIRPTIESIIGDFEKANPDIEIKLTNLTWANGHEKIVLAFASGHAPDVVELGSDWIAQFAESGHLADLSETVVPFKKDFNGWSMSTYKGKVYAVPWILGTRVMFCNRALLNLAGYEHDFIPINWEQFLDAVHKVNNLGEDFYGWGSNTAEKHRLYKKFLPFFWSNHAQIFSDDGRYCLLASENAIAALQFYKDLHDCCGYVANQRGIEDAFLEGRIGFIFSGDWLLKRIELEKRNVDYFTTLVPGVEYTGRSFMGGEFLAISQQSEQKEAAMKFIRFFTNPENQVKFCKANRSANPSSIVAQKDEYFTSNPNLQTFIAQLRSSNHPPVDPDWVYIEEAIEGAVEDALFGSGEVANALYEARKKIDRIKQTK